jgi:RNA polymerase sigma-70 factor, Bacteroides expansion family 1
VATAIVINPLPDLVMNMENATGYETDSQFKAYFDGIFREYYRSMHGYAYSIVKDSDTAEEIVQLIFCKLWQKRDQIQVQTSMKSYLYRSVHNECLNYMRGAKVREKHEKTAVQFKASTGGSTDNAAYKELQQRVNAVLNELPEQCRTIFQLSRYEEMNYKEIAEEMNVSLSTVKNEVAKALKLLRVRLADYLPLITILFFIEKI